MTENFYNATWGLDLTRTQRHVLYQMYKAGSPMSIEDVGNLIGGEAAIWPPTARVFVSKLRRALDGSGWTISKNKGGHGKPGAYSVTKDGA